MKKSLVLTAVLALVVAGGWIAATVSTTAAPTTAATAAPTALDTEPEVAAPAAPFSSPTSAASCGEVDPLALPDGVDAGPETACCIDLCQTDADCFFICRGEPGQCVMANPCCKECVCTVSSLTAAS